MIDDEHGDREAGNADQKENNSGSPLIPVATSKGGGTAEDASGDQCKSDDKPCPRYHWLKSMWSTFNGWTTIATVVIAAFTIVLAYENCQTLGILRGQLNQMQQQLPQLEGATNAARDTAGVAANQLVEFKRQFTANERPWIALDTTHRNGIISYEGGPAVNIALTGANIGTQSASFSFSDFVKNYGHSSTSFTMATGVIDKGYYPNDHIGASKRVADIDRACDEFFRKIRDVEGDLKKESSLCAGSAAHKCVADGTLFPGISVEIDLTSGITFTPQIIKNGTLSPSYFGCLWYPSILHGRSNNNIRRIQFAGDVYWGEQNQRFTIGQPRHIDPRAIHVLKPGMIGPEHDLSPEGNTLKNDSATVKDTLNKLPC